MRILELDAPRPDKVFNVMLYRLIGRPETHERIGFQTLSAFDAGFLEGRLKFIRDIKREPVFTGAYLVSGYAWMGSRDKVENVSRLFRLVHTQFDLVFDKLDVSRSAAEAYYVLRKVPGFGNFLAFQVLVDLTYPVKVCGNRGILAIRCDDWAAAGPGALKGIHLLRRTQSGASPLGIMRWLRDEQNAEFERLGLEFPFLRDDQALEIPLSLPNIQNCLCEFYKYAKIRDGTGRGRRRFVPLDWPMRNAKRPSAMNQHGELHDTSIG